MKHNLFQQYEQGLSAERQHLADFISHLLNTLNQKQALFFLLHFCALGVGMTDQVDSWISRAGQRCIELHYTNLGNDLLHHAKEEKNHHLLMQHDVAALIKFINHRFGSTLLAENFLNEPLSAGVLQYRKLHEQCILSHTPYGQLAIEYEIERISIQFGPKIIFKLLREYGFGLLKCLSFIRSHVKFDIKHTKGNRALLTAFLTEYPGELPILIDYGNQALQAYRHYLEDCASQ